MGRTKRVDFVEPVSESVAEPMAEPTMEAPAKMGIVPLDLDLGRQDLNVMVGKINEIIKKVNE